MDIPAPPLSLATRPTPVDRLDTLSEEADADIYLKRDDRTGAIAQGNKVRKLEFLLGDARAAGADVVVTGGGSQSNHCRATAILARQLDMDVHLVLAGTGPAVPDGNLLLDRLSGATIEFFDPDALADGLDARLEETAATLREAGRTPYVIPLGGSTPRGALGYLLAYTEIRDWSDEAAVEPTRIVVPLGTGGTAAGLLAGSVAFDGPRIQAIDVTGADHHECRTRVLSLARELFPLCDATPPPMETLGDRFTVDSNVGPGYATPAPADLETLVEVGRAEGIVLDPTYTAKAFRSYLATVHPDEPSLFVHTGGSYGVFPHRDALAEFW